MIAVDVLAVGPPADASQLNLEKSSGKVWRTRPDPKEIIYGNGSKILSSLTLNINLLYGVIFDGRTSGGGGLEFMKSKKLPESITSRGFLITENSTTYETYDLSADGNVFTPASRAVQVFVNFKLADFYFTINISLANSLPSLVSSLLSLSGLLAIFQMLFGMIAKSKPMRPWDKDIGAKKDSAGLNKREMKNQIIRVSTATATASTPVSSKLHDPMFLHTAAESEAASVAGFSRGSSTIQGEGWNTDFSRTFRPPTKTEGGSIRPFHLTQNAGGMNGAQQMNEGFDASEEEPVGYRPKSKGGKSPFTPPPPSPPPPIVPSLDPALQFWKNPLHETGPPDRI